MLTGLTQYVPEATLTIYDNLEFLLRLLLSAALLVGMLACGASAKTNTTVRVAGMDGADLLDALLGLTPPLA